MAPTIDARIEVLFATDLHARSRALLSAACRYAEGIDARVTLIHAVESGVTRGLTRSVRRAVLDRARSEAASALALQARQLTDAGVEGNDPILTVGEPAHRAILKATESTGAELILAGSTVREGKGHRIGSTTDRLLRSSPAPVLVLRGDPIVPFGSVAFLTDFSARARRAHLAAARLLPTTAAAEIHLLHAGDETLRTLDPTYEARTLAEAETAARALDEALVRGPGRCRARVVWGREPVEALLAAVASEEYHVVVLGTHGHGPVRRALVGSVAMGLTQSAPCSVLVVPGR